MRIKRVEYLMNYKSIPFFFCLREVNVSKYIPKSIIMNSRFILLFLFILISPSITAQPLAYDVTGGGSYCQGTGGSAVGLVNSQAGVTYTLIKDGIDQVPTVAGTGAAISFGNQLFGTYTIIGTDINGTTPMTGIALVTEKALPIVTFIVQPGINICNGVDATYTTEASMVNYVWNFSGILTTDYVIISGGTPVSYSVTIRYLTTGIRTVNINYTDTNGCSAASAITSTATMVNSPPATSAIHHQ
jgi:hypothetical protein